MAEDRQPGDGPAPAASRGDTSGRAGGVVWMLVSTVAIAAMHGSIRHVSATVHPFEIAFFRLLFGLLAVAPFFLRLGLAPLRTRRLPLLTLRGVLNVVAMLSFFTALSLTPLAEVTSISFAAPIFSILLAMVVFRERVGLRRWTAIALGFAGTLVILRPGLAEIGLGPMLAVFSAFVWGVCVVIIKELSKTESSVTITAYMSLVMAPELGARRRQDRVAGRHRIGVKIGPNRSQKFTLVTPVTDRSGGLV